MLPVFARAGDSFRKKVEGTDGGTTVPPRADPLWTEGIRTTRWWRGHVLTRLDVPKQTTFL